MTAQRPPMTFKASRTRGCRRHGEVVLAEWLLFPKPTDPSRAMNIGPWILSTCPGAADSVTWYDTQPPARSLLQPRNETLPRTSGFLLAGSWGCWTVGGPGVWREQNDSAESDVERGAPAGVRLAIPRQIQGCGTEARPRECCAGSPPHPRGSLPLGHVAGRGAGLAHLPRGTDNFRTPGIRTPSWADRTSKRLSVWFGHSGAKEGHVGVCASAPSHRHPCAPAPTSLQHKASWALAPLALLPTAAHGTLVLGSSRVDRNDA